MSDIVVNTCAGRIRGTKLDHCLAFLGVRYAQAERFEAPTTVAPWNGVIDTVSFGPAALQANPDPAGAGYGIILETMPRPAGAPPPPAMVESEDCQFLNVWTANTSPDQLKPVMVWLHPGFFMLGAGTSGNGATLAGRGDVVVVSLNHRLNLFGYSHLDDVAAGFQYSGNAGQLDIVAALEWVKRNIDRFGGDPDRVMVFGGSGGGMKTAWLLASPRGRGLLQRAGAQSGPCLRFMERDDATTITEQLLHEVGLTPNTADALRTMPAERLMMAYHRLRARNRPKRFTHLASFAPVIDPDLLPRHPFDPDAAPAARDVPMLLGWNRQDMAFFPGNDMTIFSLADEDLVKRVEVTVGPRAQQLVRTYRADDPEATASELYLRIYSDWSVGGAVLEEAARKSALGGAPTFVYRFDYPSPAFDGKLGAVHSSETAYVFGQGSPFVDGTEEAQTLGAKMRDAWVQFASSGDPNTSLNGLPLWEPFDSGRGVMLLDRRCRMSLDPIPDAPEWATP